MSFSLSYDLSGWSKIVHVLQLTNLSMFGLVKFKSALGFEENRGILKFWRYLSVLLVFAFFLAWWKEVGDKNKRDQQM